MFMYMIGRCILAPPYHPLYISDSLSSLGTSLSSGPVNKTFSEICYRGNVCFYMYMPCNPNVDSPDHNQLGFCTLIHIKIQQTPERLKIVLALWKTVAKCVMDNHESPDFSVSIPEWFTCGKQTLVHSRWQV